MTLVYDGHRRDVFTRGDVERDVERTSSSRRIADAETRGSWERKDVARRKDDRARGPAEGKLQPHEWKRRGKGEISRKGVSKRGEMLEARKRRGGGLQVCSRGCSVKVGDCMREAEPVRTMQTTIRNQVVDG